MFYEGWSYRDTIESDVKYSGGNKGTTKTFPGVDGRETLRINVKKFVFHFKTDYREGTSSQWLRCLQPKNHEWVWISEYSLCKWLIELYLLDKTIFLILRWFSFRSRTHNEEVCVLLAYVLSLLSMLYESTRKYKYVTVHSLTMPVMFLFSTYPCIRVVGQLWCGRLTRDKQRSRSCS